MKCFAEAGHGAGRGGLAELVESLEAQAMIVTRSADGMSAMTREGEYCHLPVTNTSEVFDVTGAGDTVIALITLGLVFGADRWYRL